MKTSDIQMRDPFVFVEDGCYYLFGSTDKDIWKSAGVGFDVYRSAGGLDGFDDLDDFEGPFPTFRPPPHFWSDKNFWAPEVHKYQDAYYMFATFKPKNGRRGTAVLRSAAVAGPYEPYSAGPVTPSEWECLDGTLFVEEGVPYLVFCHEWVQAVDGEICAARLNPDLRALADRPVTLFHASDAPWAAPLKSRPDKVIPPGSYVTDGPFLWKTADGGLLLLWSSFGEDGAYRIGTAKSESGTIRGPWRQSRQPLYAADGGHGMVFRALSGRLYLAIHTPNKTPDERPIFVELVEGGGELRIRSEG
ncbi:MAG: glycoside hydrolase family 43 protein [Spirochaetaceae bacterium]|nr:glycoside hydrolase family 43 protein [Spirochaetaceae bacterium]